MLDRVKKEAPGRARRGGNGSLEFETTTYRENVPWGGVDCFVSVSLHAHTLS